MLDLTIFGYIAWILLLATLLTILLAGRAARSHSGPEFQPTTVGREPPVLKAIWVLVSTIIPLGILFLIALVPDLLYAKWGSVMFIGDTILQLIGIVLFVPGAALLYLSGKYLGRYDVLEIALTTDHELVMSGPYARIRHSRYTSLLLLILMITLLLLNVFMVIYFGFALVLANHRAKMEEELLSSEDGFGDEYRLYMKRTGRFLPKL